MRITTERLLGLLPKTNWTPEELTDRLSRAGHESELVSSQIVEVTITPNRGDCLSLYGLARDLAAIYNLAFRPMETAHLPVSDHFFKLQISKGAQNLLLGDGLLRLDGYQSMESPAPVQEILAHIGLRPKELLIDLTNVVSYEIGLPLHVFDYQSVQSGLTVSLSKPDQTIKLLDGTTRQLPVNSLIQSSSGLPVDLAGISGGYLSRLTSVTTQVLVQAAVFEPKSIRRASRELQISTDASYRYQRGVDPALIELALGRFLYLAQKHSPGIVVGGYQLLRQSTARPTLLFEPEIIGRLLGTSVNSSALKPLNRLGISYDESTNLLTIPQWRHDLTTTADLSEEIWRGTDSKMLIPTQLKKNVAAVGASSLRSNRPLGQQGADYSTRYSRALNQHSADYLQVNHLKEQLKNIGAVEIVSYSFDNRVSKWQLRNPADRAYSYLKADHRAG
ncbi:MAG: phenylalanine--tRNA ligase beta subunit-related protein, partial [Patescibacteria group bacterium]